MYAPPPKPPPHWPLVAVLMVTMVAVNEVAVADVPEGAIAVTQVPALMAASVVATWWLNFVVEVQVTATWPLCWFSAAWWCR